jgi:hypothetical protein
MGWIKTSERLPEEFGQVIVNNRVPEAREQDVVICAVFFKGKFYNLEYWGNNGQHLIGCHYPKHLLINLTLLL